MVNQLRTIVLLLLSLAASVSAAEKTDRKSITAREAAHYRIVTIPTPAGVQFESGALQFLGPDRLACATRIGDLWIGDGVMGDAPQPKWTLFERGLHEVLGLAAKDGWIYATQRGEVTQLKDTNGDGRADVVETFCDGWGLSGDYHEYGFGSKFDREGNIWVVLCLTGSFTSEATYRGWGLRVTPEGQVLPTTSGVRSPGGIGFNAAGDCFYTDNQGPWNGACKLQWLKPGSFVGHPGGNKWYDRPETRDAVAAAGLKKPVEPKSGGRLQAERERIPELIPPTIYFPYPEMGQSASGVACDLSGGKFGPFQEQLFVGDQAHSTVMRVFLEKVDGIYQGACFMFRQGFDSGALYEEFAADGSLFVFCTERGWGARGGKQYALHRLVWTGETPFEIREMRAKPDGFELAFTKPASPETAGNAASYTLDTHTYIYQSSYGSPKVDATKPTISRVTVGPDGLTARLVIEGLVPGHVHELRAAGVRSATGEPLLHDTGYYTLNNIPR